MPEAGDSKGLWEWCKLIAAHKVKEGGAEAAGLQKSLELLENREREVNIRKLAEADAMMAQLLAEEEEEKKAQLAKSTKSKRSRKKVGGEPPAASTSVSTVGVEARDAGLEATVEDCGEGHSGGKRNDKAREARRTGQGWRQG